MKFLVDFVVSHLTDWLRRFVREILMRYDAEQALAFFDQLPDEEIKKVLEYVLRMIVQAVYDWFNVRD